MNPTCVSGHLKAKVLSKLASSVEFIEKSLNFTKHILSFLISAKKYAWHKRSSHERVKVVEI